MTNRANQNWPETEVVEIADTIPQFAVGDKVSRVAFTDCFGEYHAEQCGLTVKSVTMVRGISLPTYYRVYASGNQGQFEGAERYFAISH